MKKYDEAMIDFVEDMAKVQGIVIEGAVITWHQMGSLCKVKTIEVKTRGPALSEVTPDKPAKA